MSLDYQNRNDWLAVRYTPSTLHHGTTVWGKGTYAPGRNKRKRELAARDAVERRAAVFINSGTGRKTPKHRFALSR